MTRGINTVSHPIKMTTEELLENFEFLEDWEARYNYLIELGKALPKMEDALKNDQTLVKGCTSRVWMVLNTEESGKFSFIADSDAHIVRGLIAILSVIYNRQPSDFIVSFNIEEFFEKLGLGSHLSPNRRNGFFAMVERIKTLAKI